MESAKARGTVLKIARIANGYTRKEVADLAHITQCYICGIEKGTKHAGTKVLEKFAKIYNLTFFELMMLFAYYESYEEQEINEVKRYQLTLLKALDMILNKSDGQGGST